MSERRLFISFSGGETSAFMAHLCLTEEAIRSQYDAVRVVFANTGEENEETLDFVDRCDRHFGLNTVWVEAVIHHEERKSPTHQVVNVNTASRYGAPFEEAIRKYGIPNAKFKDCTRNLKLRPMESYLRSVGWAPGTYDTAIGIRDDERSRAVIGAERKRRRIVYPLIDYRPTTKPQVNAWWAAQPFRLNLKGFQGNCRWCWKKSFRKHLTLIQTEPEVFDFPRRMEEKYGTIGCEFNREPPPPPGYRRVFFRENRSVEDLFAEYEARKETFIPAHDDAQVFDAEMDVASACEESCEIFVDDQDDQGGEE